MPMLLTASFTDTYTITADAAPNFDFHTRNASSTTNPMGFKGASEAGSIGSTPAAMNAVGDAAWREYRADRIDMPDTPSAVYGEVRGAVDAR